jgi:hypothetical protein
MGLFQEYLNSKGVVSKPKVSVTSDFVDPQTPPTAAPKPQGGDYSVGGKKLKSGSEKGFGDQGDSKLKYEPKVDNTSSAAPAKIPTAEQAELCGVLVDAIKKDPTIVEQMIGQLRRNGLMGMVVAEMLQFKETYEHLAEVMSHDEYGPPVCSKLVRAMSEEVAPPFSASLEGSDEDLEDDEDLENSSVGDEEGIDDGDMDMGDASDTNEDPNSADPLMGAQQQQPMPGQQPMPQPMPPGASAMKNFQRAMMRRI